MAPCSLGAAIRRASPTSWSFSSCEIDLAVPLAWLMMAWPSWVLAARLTRRRAARVAMAAAIFAAWDVVLDPQLVQAGYWTWSHPSPGLPGLRTVPLSHLAGGLLGGALLGRGRAGLGRRRSGS